MTDTMNRRVQTVKRSGRRVSRQAAQDNSYRRARWRLRRPRSARSVVLLALAVVMLGVVVGIDRFYRNMTHQENEIELHEAMQRAYFEIETGLLLRMIAADDLSAHLTVALPLSNSAEFERYAIEVLDHIPQVRALEFADSNDIIRYVYPIAGNEAAVGLDLKDRPAERYVSEVRRLHKTIVSNPVVTAQGSLSVVIRSPILDGKRYRGTAQAVCDISSLFDPLAQSLAPRFAAALEDASGTPIWGSTLFSGATVKKTLDLGGTRWALVVGWAGRAPRPSRLLLTVVWILGLAFIGNLVMWVTRTRSQIAGLSESVEQTSADLAATQQRYRTLVETADDMILQFDLDGSTIYANGAHRTQGSERRGGEDPSESRATISDGDERSITSAFPKVIERGKHSVQYSVALESGETAHRYARLNLIRNENGRPDSVLAIVRDVTEQRRLEEETDRLQEEFYQVQKLEAIGLLAASVAHDFNNILTIISGNAELVRLQHPDNKLTCSHVDTILRAGLRAAELAGQLLSYSRRQIMPPEVVSLNHLLAQSGTFLNRLLGENIDVRLELEPKLWSVHVASTRIEQVVMNLAVNARDAMPDGGTLAFATSNAVLSETLEDRFGRLPPGEYARLTVEDNGTGMNPEVQNRLFEPFFSTKEKERGTGLGLATVHGIIKECGGHISVTSEVGKGTVFSILLPRVDSEPIEQTTQQEVPAAEAAAGTVLFAEDDAEIRLLVTTVLRERGYRVFEASNGEHALQVASEHDETIDLLLTDLIMPRMGGKALADRMRKLYPSLKIVFISGYDGEQVPQSERSADGTFLLAKPFKLSSLVAAVGEALASTG